MRPKRTISAAERTNLWTVCLTSHGVLGYLNRRISPLGARPLSVLSLPQHCRAAALLHSPSCGGLLVAGVVCVPCALQLSRAAEH